MAGFKMPPMTAGAFSASIMQQAAEKEFNAAVVSGNEELVRRARQKCHDTLDAYLDELNIWIDQALAEMRNNGG